MDDLPERVLIICTAYEQGFGKGVSMTKCLNPYKRLEDDWWAWDYGFSEGARKSAEEKLAELAFQVG